MVKSADEIQKESTKEWITEWGKTLIHPLLATSKSDLEK